MNIGIAIGMTLDTKESGAEFPSMTLCPNSFLGEEYDNRSSFAQVQNLPSLLNYLKVTFKIETGDKPIAIDLTNDTSLQIHNLSKSQVLEDLYMWNSFDGFKRCLSINVPNHYKQINPVDFWVYVWVFQNQTFLLQIDFHERDQFGATLKHQPQPFFTDLVDSSFYL